jgi:phosphoglycerate dehydrogenase-like enzyme
LLTLENVTPTAHAGFMTAEATMRMLRIAVDLATAAGGWGDEPISVRYTTRP